MTMLFTWSSSTEPWRPKRRQNIINSTHNLTTRVSYSMYASMHGSDHYDVDRIFMGLSWDLHCRWQLDHALEWCRTTGRHNSTTKVSFCTIIVRLSQVHNSDREGAVRIFVGLSCELWGFFIYIVLYYAAQFFPYKECNHIIFQNYSIMALTWCWELEQFKIRHHKNNSRCDWQYYHYLYLNKHSAVYAAIPASHITFMSSNVNLEAIPVLFILCTHRHGYLLLLCISPWT